MTLRWSHARRVWLLAALPAFTALPCFGAETLQEQIQDFASALQSGDARATISFLDPNAKEYTEIRRAIESLTPLPHTECQIDVGQVSGQGNEATVETSWTLRLNPQESGPLLIRKGRVSMGMRRSGDDWKIFSLSPLSFLARPTTAVFDTVASLATSISAGDVPGALSAFDSSARNFGQLSNDLDALLTQSDVLCAIDIVADKETEGVHGLDTDWYLEIKPKADGAGAQRRRERVQLQLEMKRGKARITVIQPLSIVSPLN